MDLSTVFGKVISELDEEISEDKKKLDKFMKMMDGVKDGNRDNEKIHVEFTSEQIDKILKYQDLVKEETIQDAIMNAIDVASNPSWEVK